MAVPHTTPVTVVPPASPIPTVTFPTSPAPMAVRLTTVVRSAPPVNPTPIAVRRRFPVTTDVPRPTPAVSALLVRATRIVMCPINLVTADVLPQTPAANVLPASPVRLRTLVPAFPAGLTPTAPVALATATPGIRVMQIQDVLRWIPVSAAETALARDKPPAALLLRYRPLLVKTVPERHATLVVPRLVLSKARKTVTVPASAASECCGGCTSPYYCYNGTCTCSNKSCGKGQVCTATNSCGGCTACACPSGKYWDDIREACGCQESGCESYRGRCSQTHNGVCIGGTLQRCTFKDFGCSSYNLEYCC